MESFFIAVVSMAGVLGVMILVHEFGHYAAAKWFGVRVDVFSIGFGKRLVGFRRGVTDYATRRLRQDGGRESAGIAHGRT
jgi:regulator of sigma E protease